MAHRGPPGEVADLDEHKDNQRAIEAPGIQPDFIPIDIALAFQFADAFQNRGRGHVDLARHLDIGDAGFALQNA